jgi:hypothetical protein
MRLNQIVDQKTLDFKGISMKKLLILSILFLLLSGCADHVSVTESIKGIEQVGFLHGLWHGYISVFAFVISLFSDDVAVYAIYNNGGWYDFGFLLGVGAFASSSSKASRN